MGNTCQQRRRNDNNEDGEDEERPHVEEERLHKLVQSDGSDFKLVFISSDSSKESGKCSGEGISRREDECSFTFIFGTVTFFGTKIHLLRLCAGIPFWEILKYNYRYEHPHLIKLC